MYNAEKYIGKCVNSILNQTYHNIEVIIVDDGSNDSSVLICKQYIANDERFKLILQRHMGVTAARKFGINVATGGYITFIDADDWIENDYYEKQLRYLNDADLLICDRVVEDASGTHIVRQPVKSGIYTKSDKYLHKNWFRSNNGYDYGITAFLWDKMFRAELLKTAVPYVSDDIFVSEDRCFSTYVMLHSMKIVICDITGYHYCRNSTSITNTVHKNYLLSLNAYYECLQKIIENCGFSFGEELLDGLNKDIIDKLYTCRHYLGIAEKVQPAIYYYPYFGRLENARIVLYGAGAVGRSFYYQICNDRESILVAWCDKNFMKYSGFDQEIISPDEISKLIFDFIIVAVQDVKLYEKIAEDLEKMGIEKRKILWNKTKKLDH